VALILLRDAKGRIPQDKGILFAHVVLNRANPKKCVRFFNTLSKRDWWLSTLYLKRES
jgi:hypothetical protein